MAQIEKLEFSYNWNRAKLDCAVFTTLRLSGRFNVGDKVEVWERDKIRGIGEVIGKIRLESIDKISEWIAYLDTGYSKEECQNIIKRMYQKIQNWENQPIYYYLIKYTK